MLPSCFSANINQHSKKCKRCSKQQERCGSFGSFITIEKALQDSEEEAVVVVNDDQEFEPMSEKQLFRSYQAHAKTMLMYTIPNKWLNTDRVSKIFRKLRNYLMDNEIDGDLYIQAQFYYLKNLLLKANQNPYPNILLGENAENRFIKFMATVADEYHSVSAGSIDSFLGLDNASEDLYLAEIAVGFDIVSASMRGIDFTEEDIISCNVTMLGECWLVTEQSALEIALDLITDADVLGNISQMVDDETAVTQLNTLKWKARLKALVGVITSWSGLDGNSFFVKRHDPDLDFISFWRCIADNLLPCAHKENQVIHKGLPSYLGGVQWSNRF